MLQSFTKTILDPLTGFELIDGFEPEPGQGHEGRVTECSADGGFPGVDLVLNPIEGGAQNGGQNQVGVCVSARQPGGPAVCAIVLTLPTEGPTVGHRKG